MNLEVRHLRLCVAVAEHQNLTKAGEVLHLTQSALSHQLRDIEEQLGVRLFHRLNRRMVATPAGERLLESARLVLAELKGTEDAIRNGRLPRTVPLRLSTECYTCYHWLPPVLKTFRSRFPYVDVRIDIPSTRRPLVPLLEGKLDLVLASSTVRDRRLAVRPLFEDEQVLIVSPDHRLAGRPYARLTDFRDERLLTYVPREESVFVNRVLQPAGVVPSVVEPVQLTEALIEMVKGGLGIAVLYEWAVEPHVRSGSLVALRITPDGFRRPWCAIMPKHLDGAEHIDEFLRLIVEKAPTRQMRSILSFQPGRRTPAAG
jgi:LysR family transcriptional regulator for metE and metH